MEGDRRFRQALGTSSTTPPISAAMCHILKGQACCGSCSALEKRCAALRAYATGDTAVRQVGASQQHLTPINPTLV